MKQNGYSGYDCEYNEYMKERDTRNRSLELAKEQQIQKLTDMSVEELRVLLEQRTKEALIEEISAIKTTVNELACSNAQRIFAAALGFKKGTWDTWEVDYTNNRQTAIANALGESVLAQIKLIMPDFVLQFTSELSANKGLIAAGKHDYQKQISRRIAEEMTRWVETEAMRRSKVLQDSLSLPEGKK